MAAKMAKVFREHGAMPRGRGLADDVPHGEVTDFYRAVKAEDGEKVVFSFVEWPDKATRDQAWEKIMADETLKPEGEMPFDGKRMFWGGFEPIFDSAKAEHAPMPAGSFIWYELMTPDPAAAKAFYDAVVGWDIEPSADRRARLPDDPPSATAAMPAACFA